MQGPGIPLGVAVLAVLVACDHPTAESSSGENVTMTATVGGFSWAAGHGDYPPHAYFVRRTGEFSISGTAGIPPTQALIGLTLKNMRGPGIYPLHYSATSNFGYYVRVLGHYPDWEWDWYWTSDSITGQAEITTFDQDQHIIKGSFSFDAQGEDGSIVEVREGTFRGHYTIH